MIPQERHSKYAGVYIHLPFCRHICRFCNFPVLRSNKERIDQYFTEIMAEIKLWNIPIFDLKSCRSIYFGGGTPSLWGCEQLAMILEELKPIADEYISFELNPEDCNLNYLRELKQIGVSRVSLGVQSFNDKTLKTMGRQHDAAASFKAVEAVHAAGFTDFNLDLLYGVYGQTLAELEADLAQFIMLKPTHISPYQMTLEEGTPAFKDKTWQSWQSSAEVILWNQFRAVAEQLRAAGFLGYELSNYSLPGFESRQNLIYWGGENFAGFGLGAHYRSENVRLANHTHYRRYQESINKNELPLLEVESLDLQFLLDEYLLMNLRRPKGVSIKRIEEFLPNVNCREVLTKFIAMKGIAKHLELSSENLSLTLSGLYMADRITLLLSEELQRESELANFTKV